MAPSKATIARRRPSRGKRRYRARVRARPSAIDKLPYDIVTEVIARVAAFSALDLHNCKISCKALHEIADEKQVLQKVSLESLSFFKWYKEGQVIQAESFFIKCQQCRNPEALFQLGVLQYFSLNMLEEGISNLEKAVEQQHKEATYVLGIILLCSGDDECTKKGYTLIMNVVKAFKGRGIVECRKKLQKVMKCLWINNKLILQSRQVFSCTMPGHEIWTWSYHAFFSEDVEEKDVCESCRCNREVEFFYRLLPRVV